MQDLAVLISFTQLLFTCNVCKKHKNRVNTKTSVVIHGDMFANTDVSVVNMRHEQESDYCAQVWISTWFNRLFKHVGYGNLLVQNR